MPRRGVSHHRPHRRQFLAQTASALSALAACGKPTPANSRLGIGVIGVGGFGAGQSILGDALLRPEIEVRAVADPDASRREAAMVRGPDIAGYADYREPLAREDIDAVYIITPDHWHALPSIHAAQAGKHVYCEKPLTYAIAEGRAMVEAARAAGIAFQTGSNLRSTEEFHRAAEAVRFGRIGEVRSVDVVVYPGPTHEPVPALPIPPELDYELWLGPAPAVPYHQLRIHGSFRWFNDYGYGTITDLGPHDLDIVQWALGRDLSGPHTVHGTATFSPGNFFECPTEFDVVYTYDGGTTVRFRTGDDHGIYFHGSDGEVFVTRYAISASRPEIIDFPLGDGDTELVHSRDHHRNWYAAITNGTLPCADVEVGHRSATMCHLAKIAIVMGRTLTWDPRVEEFVGDPEADAMRSRAYRPPWTL